MSTNMHLTTFKAIELRLLRHPDRLGGRHRRRPACPWAAEQGLDLSVEDLLQAYADNEGAVEREDPTDPVSGGPGHDVPPCRRRPRQAGQRRLGNPARQLRA